MCFHFWHHFQTFFLENASVCPSTIWKAVRVIIFYQQRLQWICTTSVTSEITAQRFLVLWSRNHRALNFLELNLRLITWLNTIRDWSKARHICKKQAKGINALLEQRRKCLLLQNPDWENDSPHVNCMWSRCKCCMQLRGGDFTSYQNSSLLISGDQVWCKYRWNWSRWLSYGV